MWFYRSRSRDHSIAHMPFLLLVHWNRAYLQPVSRYSAPKHLFCAICHCACAISRDLYIPYAKFGYIMCLTFPPSPHIAYSPWYFYWAFGLRWRISEFTLETPNVKGEIEPKFSMCRPKFAKFWRFLDLGPRSISFSILLLQKAHLCTNPRRLSHFAFKLVRGCNLQVGWGKTEKVAETPIGKTCRR